MTEVKLTRINTNRFLSRPESDRFKTQVKFSIGTQFMEWYSDLPVDDFRELLEIYQQIPHEKINPDQVQFVFDIDHRIYAEWCTNSCEGGRNWNLHSGYQGEGFTSFMDKEVHYELERHRSIEDRGSHEGYLRVRQRVLGGLALRAVELFSEWGGETHPLDSFNRDESGERIPTNDKRNLRAKEGLNAYIARYDSLKQQSQAA